MRPLLRRIAYFLQRRRRDAELREEIETHRLLRCEQLARAGASPAEAERLSARRMGNTTLAREDAQEVWAGVADSIRADLRVGLRTLLAHRGFSAVAIATLALGIGASVTLLSVMQAVLWRHPTYPQADRLVVVDADFGPARNAGLSPGELLALREASRTLPHVAMASSVSAFVTVNDEMERVTALSVSDDLLELLGGVAMGRAPAGTDVRDGSVSAVAISHRLWTRMFARDPDVLGRRIQVNNLDVEIAGVLPESFRVSLPASMHPLDDEQVDVWFPNRLRDDWVARESAALARLAPGMTHAQAQAELDALAGRFMQERSALYADAVGPLRFRVEPLRDVLAAPVARQIYLVAAAVGLILLIACVNVTNLMLARVTAREGEIATRIALGAGGRRVVRQLLTESVVLAMAGCAGGLLIGWAGLEVLAWARPAQLPRQSEIALDWPVALAAVGLSLMVTAASALVPAVRVAAAGAAGSLVGMRSIVAPRRQRRWQRVLVAAEVALSIVPLVAAGLFVRSFVAMVQVPLGFEPDRVITARAGMSFSRYPDAAARWALLEDALAAVSALPGVESVGGASPLPLEPGQMVRRFYREGGEDGLEVAATQQSVLPGFLETVSIPLVQGRHFTGDDIALRRNVAIVDEPFARAFWPNRDTIAGQRIHVGSGAQRQALEVIGVTKPVRVTRVREQSRPHVFVPFHLFPVEMSLVVRTGGDVAALGPAIKRSVEALGTERAVHSIRPMEAYVSDSLREEQVLLAALSIFAAMSLLLAAVGVHGTLAYLTAQRTPEFGLRVALGSTTVQILGLVAKEGAVLVGAGLAAGIAGAVLVAQSMRGMLYAVAPLDLVTLAAVTVLVCVAAVVAVARPAWRAARVDPTIALRIE